jgi:acetyl esterase/lipase
MLLADRLQVLRPSRWLCAALCAGLVAALPALAQTPAAPAAPPAEALPSVEAFFSRPAVESASLSPSGRWLAVRTAPAKARVGVFVFDLSTMKAHAQVARFSDSDIGSVYWVNDETLVFDIQDNQRGGADQVYWPGLYSVNKDGKGQRLLIDVEAAFFRQPRVSGREPLSFRHRLLHVPDGDGNEVIVGEYPEPTGDGQQQYVNAKRLDVTTGLTTNLARGAPNNVREWMFDAAGKPRLVTTSTGSRGAYHWRDKDDGPWRVLAEFERLSAPWSPQYLDTTGALWVSVSDGTNGTSELRRFDFTTGKPQARAEVRTPGFDFLGSIVSESVGDLALGVRVTTDAETTVWFHPPLQALQKAADERLPGHINRITCRRCLQDDIVAVVYSWNDRDPGQYWIYRGTDKSWRKLADARPEIDPRRMAVTDMARVRMRDGLEIPVWVTRPSGPVKAPRATVVLVHGGPWARGRTWRWDGDAQFLASRGYVVIEPEFRGSTGYGQRLFRAGWRQWGQSMQDDLVDALGWAVGKGWVDKDRVCIAGASYGGYATLMGLVRHPESFRCGVAWLAVTDPRLMFKWSGSSDVSNDARNFDLPTLIGDPVTDLAMLEANTPLLQAQRIRAPVMMGVGAVDRRVPLVHGERMRDALTAAGRPPEWVAYADEGHGFFKVENRIDFMRRMESFLAKHLGAR